MTPVIAALTAVVSLAAAAPAPGLGTLASAVVADSSQAPAKDNLLAVGAEAPEAKGESVAGGKKEQFDLRKALQRRAVVLYFFPKAFTEG